MYVNQIHEGWVDEGEGREYQFSLQRKREDCLIAGVSAIDIGIRNKDTVCICLSKHKTLIHVFYYFSQNECQLNL